MKNFNNGSGSNQNNSHEKSSESNSDRRSLIDSMRESVGPMDCTYGYSVKKLARYFEKEYRPNPLRFPIITEPTNTIPKEYIWGFISEILIAFDEFQNGVKRRFKNHFDSHQLSVIFQFFNGIAFNYEDLDITDPYFDFINHLEFLNDCTDTPEPYISDLLDKMYDIHCIEFFLLGLLIMEDWHTVGSPSNTRLFEILLEDSEKDSSIPAA